MERTGERYLIPRPGDRALVVGLGASGFAAARLLQRLGCSVVLSDARHASLLDRDKLNVLEDENISVESGGHEVSSFHSAQIIVVSPGVPTDLSLIQEAGEKNIPIIGEMELAARVCQKPVIAITGTNGKSTVTTLTGELLRAAGFKVFVGGNLGTPLSDFVLRGQDADFAVCEVSSFQLDTAETMRPFIAVLLNISPDHLDRYCGSFHKYRLSKMSLFANQRESDVAIINIGDREIEKMLSLTAMQSVRKFYAGKNSENLNGYLNGFLNDKQAAVQIEGKGDQEFYNLSGTALEAAPNNENALAAILAARYAGCSPESIRVGLKAYGTLPHRMTHVAQLNGITFIDDSKATNVGATAAALCGLSASVILIAGGRDKGGDYDILSDIVREKVKTLLLIGEASEKMAASLGSLTHTEKCKTLEGAVTRAFSLAISGDTVLLSPACSSFDMFTSYSDRGDAFRGAVLRLQ